MRSKLAILQGKKEGEVFYIEEGARVVIGRSVHCNLQLLDEGLSRTHAVIENKGLITELTDLKSSNGTFVNEDRIETKTLASGDIVRVGNVLLEFTKEGYLKDTQASIHIVDDSEMMTLDAEGSVRKRFDLSSSSLLSLADLDLEVGESRLRYLQKALSTLYKVGSVIHSERSKERLFNTIMDSILDVVEADRGFLLLADETEPLGFRPEVIRMKDAGSEEVNLSRTVVREVLERGMSIISADVQSDQRFADGKSIMLHGIRSVMCLPLETMEKKRIGAIYLDTITPGKVFSVDDLDLINAVAHQSAIAIERMQLASDLKNLLLGAISAIVAAIEAKDPYTSGHSERVTKYGVLISREMHLPGEVIELVRLAGLMHDVGKIGIPETILNSEGILSSDEMTLIRLHPDHGGKILSSIQNENIAHVCEAIRHHHERFDGTGYPDGLSGSDIPVASRILTVADAFDAMTSNRRYRRNFTPQEVIDEIKTCTGTQFDPDVTEAFLNLYMRREIVPLSTRSRQKDEASVSVSDEETPTRLPLTDNGTSGEQVDELVSSTETTKDIESAVPSVNPAAASDKDDIPDTDSGECETPIGGDEDADTAQQP